MKTKFIDFFKPTTTTIPGHHNEKQTNKQTYIKRKEKITKTGVATQVEIKRNIGEVSHEVWRVHVGV